MTTLRISSLAITVIAILAITATADADPAIQDIVAGVDLARNPQQPFRQTSTLTEYVHGQARDRTVLTIHAKLDPATRQYKNLVRYADPPRDTGKLVLMNASTMWFYDPASKASIRISPQQRLTGQASDGDVLAINIAHDYAAKLVGGETIKDADHRERSVWHLDLTAATGDAIYSHVEYWVEQGSYQAIKGKFYADSGRLLKICYYRNPQQVLGALRPTETVIIDAVDANLVTTVVATDYRTAELPDAWFQRDYLPRFDQ